MLQNISENVCLLIPPKARVGASAGHGIERLHPHLHKLLCAQTIQRLQSFIFHPFCFFPSKLLILFSSLVGPLTSILMHHSRINMHITLVVILQVPIAIATTSISWRSSTSARCSLGCTARMRTCETSRVGDSKGISTLVQECTTNTSDRRNSKLKLVIFTGVSVKTTPEIPARPESPVWKHRSLRPEIVVDSWRLGEDHK